MHKDINKQIDKNAQRSHSEIAKQTSISVLTRFAGVAT